MAHLGVYERVCFFNQEIFMNKRIKKILPSFEGIAGKVLKDHEFLLIKLFYFEGISQEQVAKAFNIHVQEASKIHNNAISKIRDYRKEFMEEYDCRAAN